MSIIFDNGGSGGGSDAISGGFKIFELMFNQTTGDALPAGTVRAAIFADKTAMQDYFTSKPSEFDRFKDSGRVCEIGTIDSSGKPLTINNEAYAYVAGEADPYVNVVGGLIGEKGDFIDDNTVSTDKTYSSNKIEARIESDGFPNDGYIILNESYKTLKKGVTYIYGRDDDLSELPDLNSRQLNIVNFGDIYNDRQNLFLLASPNDDDGIWCWCRVAGVLEGKWFRIGSYNDMLKLDAITDTGSGKIITSEERTKLAGLSPSKDPSDGFYLKPDADIGMDSSSALMIKNNAGDYHNAIDQDINLDAIRLGSQGMRTYLRTNEPRIQIQTSSGMKTIAHLDDLPTIPSQHQLIEREDLHVVDEYYGIPETDLYKWKVYVGRLGNSIYDNIVHIKLPTMSTYEQYFWFDGVNDDKKDTLPPATEYVFSCGWEATAEGFRISSLDGSIDVYGMTDLVTKVPNKVFRFQFVKFQNGRWGLVYSDYDENAWIPFNQVEQAYSGTPSNFNVQIVDGVGYQRVDRQYPVTTTDNTTEKFRLIRTVTSENGDTLPTVKKIQPPEIGSGFSFFTNNTDPSVGSTILQISSGTYTLETLGIDSATVGYGDEVYVQPDGSLGTTFSRYQCGWVLDDGVIIDIDLYNASALSEGGFPTDPVFDSVTTDLIKSKISANNYLQFNNENVAELKTNRDIELNPSTSLKFKIGNTQKAILTALRLDMGDTPISNVPNAVLDKDAAPWKQIRDYVDSHVTPVPDDLSVNSLTAASFVSTPVIKAPATKMSVDISSEEVASFSLGSLDLKDNANNSNGSNITGVYKVIGADSESHIAIPNANMVLHAKETVVFQDQGSDYLYIDRNQGILFAGTSSGLIPDYSGNGAYLKGDKAGIKNWSGNDVITVDKSQGDVINANNHRIENLLAPVNDLDASNKKFVVDITNALEGRVQSLESTVASQEEQISQLLSSVISLQQDINELIESNKQSVTNFVMYSETDNTLRMDMDRIGGQGLTQTVTFGQNPPPTPPEPPLPEQVTVYFGWDVNEMGNMQASDFQNYQGTDERTANLYITADTLMTTDLQITRSNTERYKYSYIAYPKGLVDPDPLKVTYSGFVDSWNSREMVIDGHTYIVLVPEYPNINATMDMKLSY